DAGAAGESTGLRPDRSLVDGELLPQGEVLEGELVVAAAEEREEPKEVEQDADHRAGILSGSKPIDQPLAAGRSFGEGQVDTAEPLPFAFECVKWFTKGDETAGTDRLVSAECEVDLARL